MNATLRRKFRLLAVSGILGMTSLAIFAPRMAAQEKAAVAPAPSTKAVSAEVAADPVLKAMREELDRSKSQLKMDNVAAPYYIEYRIADVEEWTAESAFGSLRQDQQIHARSARVVVRVGDYKLDSYYGPGLGIVDYAPLDNDPIAIRRELWLATDAAYKAANEALASKKALLSQYTADQPFDDFAKATPLEYVGPLAKLDFTPAPWKETIEKATDLYRTNLKIQAVNGFLRFRAVNEYFVNTEGTSTRQGYTVYTMQIGAETQSTDGMKVGRTPFFVERTANELPSPAKFLADAGKTLATLQALADAPMVEEDYRGPVLFSNDAASDVFEQLVAQNVLGIRPKPGESARTTGEYSSNYKGRVLPTFISVTDDPTLKTFDGRQLVGSYEIDQEGVKASAVPLITDGILVDYLIGRMPIRDFPASNGHGRAAPGQAPSPNIGNFFVKIKDPVTKDELKKKLIEMCKQQGKPYGYYVETMAGDNPRLLYRIYVSDGHDELVRGAVFNELDTRTLRNNLIAAGSDPLVSNRGGSVPTTIICPSVLFDELEVKRTDRKNAKLPEYPSPELTTH
jgi:predicted Zn-dependent protease